MTDLVETAASLVNALDTSRSSHPTPPQAQIYLLARFSARGFFGPDLSRLHVRFGNTEIHA